MNESCIFKVFRSASIRVFLCICLVLGLLPSFTALNQEAWISHSPLRYLAPINFLKICIPLFGLYLLSQYQLFSKKFSIRLISVFLIGTVFSFLGLKLCSGQDTAALREWAAMLFGALASLTFVALPPKNRAWVAAGWAIILLLLTVLDRFFPSSIDWLYVNVFDPNTRWFDSETSRARILTGVFGFQSMGKLLSWAPWLTLAFTPWISRNRPAHWAWIFTASLFTGLILSTTQRAPLLGMSLAWVAYAIHGYAKEKKPQIVILAIIAGILSLAFTFVFTPSPILDARVGSNYGAQISNSAEAKAEPLESREVSLARDNVNFRKRMWQLSLKTIAHFPLGNACLTDSDFREFHLYKNHSHNLFLHQFRERGWVWGLLHLFLWAIAALKCWQSKKPSAGALFAGITCICTQGMFDHPWFVMNQAMMLSIFLIASFNIDRAELAID
jgi:hypothetical protein